MIGLLLLDGFCSNPINFYKLIKNNLFAPVNFYFYIWLYGK